MILFSSEIFVVLLLWLLHLLVTLLTAIVFKFWDNFFEADADADEDLEDSEDTDWEEIHNRNFRCSIDTRLRSFYFKILYNAIAFNNFLFKINCKIPLTVISVKSKLA